MAFTDANHQYTTREARKRGQTKTEFVNLIIYKYSKEE